ncbi:isochorismatase family protein [Thermoflavimicrobium dichotomicum]|nr:isochorismatase family protein [Thermoflavimicrobium dichotomicum]
MTTFLSYIKETVDQFPSVSIRDLVQRVNGANRVYLVFVDIIKGFCETGPLSSKRVNEMVAPVAELADQLLNEGMPSKNIVFLNDDHPANAVEFAAFAPHCIRGTAEAEVVDVLKPIQELKGVQTFKKNATNGLFGVNDQGQTFHAWLEETFDKGESVFIVVGDCTDLCIYQNAMGIRLLANEKNAPVHVVVSKEHVRTYDLSVEQAKQLKALAHDGDFMDLVFLYHMKLNGIEVVSSITHA